MRGVALIIVDNSTRRSRKLGLWCLAVVLWAGTAGADTYLVLSLLGDRLTIITAASAVGSRLPPGSREVVQLKETHLDDFAARTAGATIEKALPAASVTMIRATDPGLYKMRNAWIDADSVGVRDLVALVAQLFSPPADSHLLLIAPFTDDLELKTDRKYLGAGNRVAGLGFYVDGRSPMFDTTTLINGVGFLGVFTNFQILLINLQNNAIETQQRIVVGNTFAAARAPDKQPWNALSADQKVAALQFLMKREIDRVLPGMLRATTR